MAKIKNEDNKEDAINVTGMNTRSTLEEENTAIDEFISGILKKYPNYKELYVDRSGGTYTTDTPSSLRLNAKLFKNPFYHKK